MYLRLLMPHHPTGNPSSSGCTGYEVKQFLPDCDTADFFDLKGDLQFGTGSLPIYNGSSFAGFQDVLVVTFNYR